jgi:hypothetical protein
MEDCARSLGGSVRRLQRSEIRLQRFCETVLHLASNLRISLSSSVHSLVGEPVGGLIVFAEGMTNFKMFKPPYQLLRLVVQLAQFGMPHFVDAFHLADHQFGIANHLEGFDLVFGGVAESGDEPLILGVVIGVMSEVFTKLGNWVASGILYSHAVAGRPRIAASSAIDVSSVRGRSCSGGLWRSFKRRKKIAGTGRARGHRSEFTTCAGPGTAFRRSGHIRIAVPMTIVAPSRHDLSLLGVFRHHTSAAAKPWQPPEPATTWSECVNDKVNDKAANGKTKFDWVTERSSCSLPKVFNTLRLEVAEDVKTRNALRPNNSPYEFSIAEKGRGFYGSSKN